MQKIIWVLMLFFIFNANESIWAQEIGGRPLKTIDSKAVFKPPSRDMEIEVIGKLHACADANSGEKANESKFIACVISVMQKAGASTQATAFTKMLKGEGYLDSFRAMGRVDLGNVFYPFRANENWEFILVNGKPQVINVGDPDNLKRIDIKKDPLYPSLIRQFTELELWGHAEFKTMKRLAEGGQRFIFSFVLLNGCHACEIGGYADIAFDFNSKGCFLGTNLIRLNKATRRQ